MKFQPQTAEEIAASGLLPDGVYDVEVMEASERTSAAGNAMIVLDLMVYGAHGERRITDYVVSNLAWKVRGAAEGFGLMDRHDLGELSAEDFLGKSARANVVKQDGKDGYKPKNVIKSYEAKPGPQRMGRPAPRQSQEVNDDIPF